MVPSSWQHPGPITVASDKREASPSWAASTKVSNPRAQGPTGKLCSSSPANSSTSTPSRACVPGAESSAPTHGRSNSNCHNSQSLRTVEDATFRHGSHPHLAELRSFRIKAAPLRSAARRRRAALWLEAPRARARQLGAVEPGFWVGSSPLPNSPASTGIRRERSASPAAMACGHSRLNPAESRRPLQLSRMTPGQVKSGWLSAASSRLQRSGSKVAEDSEHAAVVGV